MTGGTLGWLTAVACHGLWKQARPAAHKEWQASSPAAAAIKKSRSASSATKGLAKAATLTGQPGKSKVIGRLMWLTKSFSQRPPGADPSS
jgi:hypothetical protein